MEKQCPIEGPRKRSGVTEMVCAVKNGDVKKKNMYTDSQKCLGIQ